MKWKLFLLAALAICLSGCATLNTDDRLLLKQHRVSEVLFDKMIHGEVLAVPDVIELSAKGVPDPFIINYLRTTETSYTLTADDVITLKKAGVSSNVINYLLATPSMFGPPRYPYYPAYGPYGDPYYYGYPPVIVVRPGFHH